VTVAPSRERRPRLDPEIFDLPVEKMRDGYYSDAYFNHTRAALLHDGRRPRVLVQLFQRHRAMLGGMDESIAILELCSYDWPALTVHALRDGDWLEPWETVMTIEGDYTAFGYLETVVLGTLARRTLIATNTARVLEAANGKPIIFMPARHDHHRVQTGDGYAAHVAGAVLGAEIGVTSDAQASWWGGRGLGTVPHSLIAAYGGNTVLAATKFAEWAPEDFRITVLVDFENDSVRTALEVARALGPRLWGVRLDTSGQLVARRGRLRAGQDRRLGRLRRGEDRGVRAAWRPGGRLRRRLVADPRRERLHGGHRDDGRPPDRQGRPAVQAERAARAGPMSIAPAGSHEPGPITTPCPTRSRRRIGTDT
jgi:nicotinate phosphoribosyltransferase